MQNPNFLLKLICALFLSTFAQAQAVYAGLPQPAHIVIVMEENHSFSEIIGTDTGCTYINSLANNGALMTYSFGCGHQSEDNYDSLFFGNPEDNGTNFDSYEDACPNPVTSGASMGASLFQAGFTFCGYSEGIEFVGSTLCSSTSDSNYNLHHCPWIQANVTNGGNMPVSCGQPFSAFPTNFNNLPNVSIVIPDNNDNMHSNTPASGDTWLSTNLGAYATWCQTPANNSLLIVTWDEDDTSGTEGDGTTVGNTSDNHIPTIFYGSMVNTGQYSELINHYNVLTTVLSMYGISNSTFSSAASATTITDIFSTGSPIPTGTPTLTATATSTNSPTLTATITLTPSQTPTPSLTNTPTASDTPGGNTETFTNTPTLTATATITNTPIGGAIAIAFTGLATNGNSQFSFVSMNSLSSGQVIYFTNESYDATIPGLVSEGVSIGSTPVTETDPNFGGVSIVLSGATTVTESVISLAVGSTGLSAYSPVVIGKSGSSLQGGVVSGPATFLTFNHNGTGNKVFAFTVSGGVTTYVAGLIFGPNTWQTSGSVGTNFFWDSYLPPGLSSSNSTDLSGLWNSGDFNQWNIDNEQNNNAVVNPQTSQAGIVNPLNWSGDGDESKTFVNLATPTGVTVSGAGYTGLLSVAITSTATNTQTPLHTSTPTSTPTMTPTLTPSNTTTQTGTPTNSPTITDTQTITNTPTITNTSTLTFTPTITNTPTITGTYTNTSTVTATPTITNTPTITDTPTVTNTPTLTATSTITGTPTATRTPTPSPAATGTGGAILGAVMASPNISHNGSPIDFHVVLNQPAQITLTLLTILGQTVYQTSVQGNAGDNSILWNLQNGAQSAVGSGLYICVIQASNGNGTSTQIHKVVVLH